MRPLTFVALTISVALLAGCSGESRVARPYQDNSVWNDTIAQKGGTLASSNPVASQFGTMFFGGGPGGSSSHDHDYAKPIYLEVPGDPCRPVFLRHADWNTSDTRIPSNACVPVPSDLQAAAGSDGHVTVIAADLRTAWDFWRCKVGSDSGPACSSANVLSAGRYEAAAGAQWKTHPDDSAADGVASCCGSATGRGSGTDLLTTTLKQDEAEYGIDHALGLTLPGNASGSYVNPPAVKTDGSSGSVKYGSLWALDPNYQCPTATGPKNVCEALKAYGVYIVDQGSGSGSEIDTTGDFGTQTLDRWQRLGLTRNSLPIPGSAWRCVSLPTVTGECP